MAIKRVPIKNFKFFDSSQNFITWWKCIYDKNERVPQELELERGHYLKRIPSQNIDSYWPLDKGYS